MTHLWMDHTDPLCLVNLKVVIIEECGALKFIFPHPTAKCLSQLQSLSVSGCGMLEGIVSKGGEGSSTGRVGEIIQESNDLLVLFPKLTKVIIDGSPNLRGFYNLDDGRGQSLFNPKVMLPSIQYLEVDENDSIKAVFDFEGLEAMTMREDERLWLCELREIILCKLPKLEHLCRQVPKDVPIFQNLGTLDVRDCHHLAYLLPSSLARMLVNLQILDVTRCNGMKVVFDFEGLEAMTMREDERLLLCELRGIDLQRLPKLEHLCRQVPKGVPIFQNLGKLRVYGCHSLAYLIPSSIARMLVNLQELQVWNCNGMKEVISKMNEEEEEGCGELEKNIVFPSLTEVTLEDLENLSSFCSSDQQVFEFPSLEVLEISNCPEMETFCCQIPRVAPSRMLEENVNKGEASTAAGGGGEIYTHCNQAEIKMDPSDLAALFPKLKKVRIENTPNFRGFYNIERYQVLVNLAVRASHQLKQMVEVGGDNLVSVAASTSPNLVQNLKHIKLEKCEAIKALLDFDGFEVTREDAHSVFNSLETIRLRQFSKLEHICRLLPKEVNGFRNLRSLHVYGCHSLSYLLTSTMAHMLLNLKFLVVWNCNSMKEVIKRDEDCGANKIVFRSLCSILLSSEKLSSFCSSELQEFDFPSLNGLVIFKCPAMTTFCCGHLTAEKLGGVLFYDAYNLDVDDISFNDSDLEYNDDGNDDAFWKGDVNETICHFNSSANRLKRHLKEDGVDDNDADEAEEDDGDVGDEPLSRNDLKDTAQHLDARVSQISCHVREDEVGDKDAEDVDDIHVPKEGVDNEYDQCGNEAASSNKLTRALSTPLVGSSPDASLMSNNDDELSHVNDIVSSASIELFVPSSDSPVRHFNARDDNQNSDLKEEGIDNSAAAEDADIDESARCNTEPLDHSSTSSSTPLDQGTSSKPTKALVAPLIASSPDPSLALVFVPPLLHSNQESAYSSIPNLGKVEFIPPSLSKQSVPSSDSPMRKTADNRKPSDPSSSSSDDDWKGSRVLIQGVYVKAEMKKTFEDILTAYPNFHSGLRFKKAEIKTMFVESAISSLQSLGQYTARTMSEEQLTCIKESLDDLVASGLEMGWLERGYKRAGLVMKQQKAVLAATELARLDRKKVEAEAAFEIAKAQLEDVMALRDASKAECDALFEQVEEGKNLFGGGFDQDTSLGHGLLY